MDHKYQKWLIGQLRATPEGDLERRVSLVSEFMFHQGYTENEIKRVILKMEQRAVVNQAWDLVNGRG